MSAYLDSSVLVAALVEDEETHEACLTLLRRRDNVTWSHALAEVFATLTGGRLGIRVSPAIASRLIEESLLPRLRLIELGADDVSASLRASEASGVRGGAIFDFLHLVAARKAGASTLHTLNERHFLPLANAGDPKVEGPV